MQYFSVPFLPTGKTKMHVLKVVLGASVLLGLASASPASAGAAKTRSSWANACEVARKYIRLTDQKRYDEVGELWAPDAVFFNPRGEIIRGKPAIKLFYSTFLRKITPVNRIASLAWDPKGNVCVMELETRVVRGPDGKWMPDARGEFVPSAIDRFVVNNRGKVQQMRVYLPPDKAWLEN